MTKTKILVASAGTGKTTRLMDILEGLLETTPPEKIVFTTYTNAGANEAIERAVSRFGFERERFQYFRTLHSLCFRNIRRQTMMSQRDYAEMGRSMGYPTTGVSAMSMKDGIVYGGAARGDKLLALNNLMRNRRCSYEEICRHQTGRPESPATLKHFSESYRLFKDENCLIDFTDQLELFISEGAKLDIDYLLVDEAQDASKLQWAVVDRMAKWVKEVFIAGDDKQAIYEFSGGDPDALIERIGDREVLGHCYRLPDTILGYAESIANRIRKKTPYSVSHTTTGGFVHRIRNLNNLDMSQGTWLLLARNRVYLEMFEKEVVSKGYLFKSQRSNLVPDSAVPCIRAWEALLAGNMVPAADLKTLYRTFLPTGSRVKRGFKKTLDAVKDTELLCFEDLVKDYGLLTSDPWPVAFSLADNVLSYLLAAEKSGQLDNPDRIEITTIHSTKGREADNVVILPDMAWTTWNEFQRTQDPEHRVFYVACSRAKQNLYIHDPITTNFYPLP